MVGSWSGARQLSFGESVIRIDEMNLTRVNATVQSKLPPLNEFQAQAFRYRIASVEFAVAGVKSAPQIKGTAISTELVLGSMSLTTAQFPIQFELTSQSSLDLKIKGGSAQVAIGGAGFTQLRGGTKDVELTGQLTSLASSPQLFIDSLGFKFTLLPVNAAIPAFGGELELLSASVPLVNKQPMRFYGDTADAVIDGANVDLQLKGVKLLPTASAIPQSMQQAPVRARSQKLALNLSSRAVQTINFDASFEFPGFEIKPPEPIKSITVEVGNFDIEVQSLKIGRFGISLHYSDVIVSLHEVGIGVGQFETRPPKPDEKGIHPNIRGRASSDLSVNKLFATISLLPAPISLRNFGISGLKLAAERVTYVAPEGMRVESGSAKIELKELLLPQQKKHNPLRREKGSLEASIELDQNSVAWEGAPNGRASVETIRVKLNGDPELPNGEMTLNASAVSLGGKANIKLGT